MITYSDLDLNNLLNYEVYLARNVKRKDIYNRSINYKNVYKIIQ